MVNYICKLTTHYTLTRFCLKMEDGVGTFYDNFYAMSQKTNIINLWFKKQFSLYWDFVLHNHIKSMTKGGQLVKKLQFKYPSSVEEANLAKLYEVL